MSVRYLVLADIHGNLAALRAVLASPEAARCDQIVSLGDHTNFGPAPRQVQEALEARHALILRGNHEDRFARIASPEFDGYNWRMLRWTHEQLAGMRLDYPTEARLGPLLMTHAVPGDVNRLIYPPEEVLAELARLPAGVTCLLTGHNHAPWLIAAHGLIACNPGSLGLTEDGVGGRAPFAVVETRGNQVIVTRHAVRYDLRDTVSRFLSSGLAAVAPELSRAVLLTMRAGGYQTVLRLIRHVNRVAAPHGLTVADEEAWRLADRAGFWQDPIDSRAFWRREEASLQAYVSGGTEYV